MKYTIENVYTICNVFKDNIDKLNKACEIDDIENAKLLCGHIKVLDDEHLAEEWAKRNKEE